MLYLLLGHPKSNKIMHCVDFFEWVDSTPPPSKLRFIWIFNIDVHTGSGSDHISKTGSDLILKTGSESDENIQVRFRSPIFLLFF